MKLNPFDEELYTKLFEQKHGFNPVHSSIKSSMWNIAVWNNDSIASIVSKPQDTLSELDKIWSEINSTEKNTTVKPVSVELNGSHFAKPLLFQDRIDNILTNPGMKNMAQLSTAESTKTNTHCVVGDGTVSELVTDVSLGNQLTSKAFDSEGDRETVDQQERYAMAFFRSDFGQDVILREAGITTGPTPPTDVLTSHVTFADKALGTGQTMTVQITVSHKNGTQ